MKHPLLNLLICGAVALLATGCGDSSSPGIGDLPASVEVKPIPALVVYSARQEHLIKPLFDAYTAKTGVTIEYIIDGAGPLLARLKAEGERSPADLLLTTDAGNLWHAANSGLLQTSESVELAAVPSHLRDPDHNWYGLSVRARTIVYATDRVQPGELSSYEALAGAQWRGRLCLRTAKKVYNQSLVATLIASHGEPEAERIVSGWVANLAVPPFSNDTKVMEAIVVGQCDVGIVNTYYYGRLMNKQPQATLALFWPNQEGEPPLDRGVHVNVSGAGVTRHAPQVEAARALLSWLSSFEAQQIFASLNQEYPVLVGVPVSAEVARWGSFKQDPVNLAVAGELQARAIRLMDRAGYQ
jgi:iron(III) transport system substrate-binding protein